MSPHRWQDRNPKPAWGKYEDETGHFHPLEHHAADVAACFEALLRDPVLRDRLAHATGESAPSRLTEARLVLLAFLHDFGKLNAGFQFSVLDRHPGAPRKSGHIEAAVWGCRHPEFMEALGLANLLSWGAETVQELMLASLAHHGRPAPLSSTHSGPDAIWRSFANYDPIAAARLLARRGHQWFPNAFEDGPVLPTRPELAHFFAGLLAIADQLGSNRAFFPFEPTADRRYMDRARAHAREAVRASGFRREGWADDARVADLGTTADYKKVFGFDQPRPLQEEVASAPVDIPLLILESETGSGKTEAALIRFAKLWRAGRVDGLYFALPTRSAAVAIHQRVHRAIRRLLPPHAQVETVLAVPGYLKVGEVHGMRVGQFEVEWRDDPSEAELRARWAAESARKFLSATVAVGTIDQAMLSALMTKWAHFRGASLARSLLVVDEVHASDVYMTEILRRVIRDHLALGGHALLMSATLGAGARDKFVKNDTDRLSTPTLADAKSDPYPVLTLARRDQTSAVRGFAHTGYSRRVRVFEDPIMETPGRIAERAIREAERGGRVLVVLNTVGQAQAVFAEVRDQGGETLCLRLGDGPALHHSRFAAEDRRLLDGAVERTLGKEGESRGCIVIGTQTLEQSLDIDADVLITHLCPMDVLLQRIGRLHRRQKRRRPDGFAEPRCHVLVPDDGLEAGLNGGLLRYGLGLSRHGGIYRDLGVLELTRRMIAERSPWRIPEDNRVLVEEAVHAESCAALQYELGGGWLDQAQEAVGVEAAERQVARRHLLERTTRFADLHFPEDELVRTRLGEDGPRIKLPNPVLGPFGESVQTFNLPAHLFRGRPVTKSEVESASLERSSGRLLLRLGEHVFRYGRSGVRS